jgi:hypothetical protein
MPTFIAPPAFHSGKWGKEAFGLLYSLGFSGWPCAALTLMRGDVAGNSAERGALTLSQTREPGNQGVVVEWTMKPGEKP